MSTVEKHIFLSCQCVIIYITVGGLVFQSRHEPPVIWFCDQDHVDLMKGLSASL